MLRNNYYITGSTGFLGKNLLKALDKNKTNITCIIRKRPRKRDKDVSYIYFKDFFRKKIDENYILFHIAAQIRGRTKSLMKANFDLSKLLLDKAKKEECAKFIFISSYDVEMPKLNIYARTKILFEKYLLQHFSNYLIIRPSVIFGVDDTKNFQTLFKLLKIVPIMILPKNGNILLRPVHINDLVNEILKLVDKEGIYTIMSKKIVKFGDIVRKYFLIKKLNKRILNIPFDLGLIPDKIKIQKLKNRKAILTESNILDWMEKNKNYI